MLKKTNYSTLIILAIIFFAHSMHINAQNWVTGTIQSIPSKTAPDSARITLTHIAASHPKN